MSKTCDVRERENRNIYRDLMCNWTIKTTWGPGRRWENNITIDLRVIGLKYMDWISDSG
jgi:hypothetical protein